ncbi:hypothetical protein ACHAQJ_004170 [Trichoderma viride]
MTLSIKSALLIGALAYVAAGNPLPSAVMRVKHTAAAGESDRKRDLEGVNKVVDLVKFEFDDDADTRVFFQGQGSENCTARVLQVPKLNLGPTRTIFTTTTTASRIVNCGTCTNASPVPIPLGVPPVAIFHTTVTATEPFTATELVCSSMTDALVQATTQSAVALAESKASPQNVAAAITATAVAPSQTSL